MLEVGEPIENIMETKLKQYPLEIDHFNPKSKNYIHD